MEDVKGKRYTWYNGIMNKKFFSGFAILVAALLLTASSCQKDSTVGVSKSGADKTSVGAEAESIGDADIYETSSEYDLPDGPALKEETFFRDNVINKVFGDNKVTSYTVDALSAGSLIVEYTVKRKTSGSDLRLMIDEMKKLGYVSSMASMANGVALSLLKRGDYDIQLNFNIGAQSIAVNFLPSGAFGDFTEND